MFRSGENPTTQIGYTNKNKQECNGTLGVAGTDHMQFAYRMEYLNCGYVYGVRRRRSSDIFERKCPECPGGESGIRYWRG
jgi:hypothetical protein